MTEAEDFRGFDSSRIVNSVCNAFLSYTAIMLNIITIHALRKISSLPKPVKTLFLSLAVSDLGVGLLVQPLYVASLVKGFKENAENNLTYKITNNMLLVSSVFLSFASFFGVTALTADRFLSIHLHLRYQELITHRRVVAVVISSWALSVILSPLGLWNPKIFFYVIGIITTICLILTTFFNCKIYLAVRRHIHQIQVLQVQQVGHNVEVAASTARQIKSAVVTFHVYVVFLVCYLPHISMYVVHAIGGVNTTTSILWGYSMTLVYLNSSLNPLVYSWKMRHVRHHITNMLRNMFLSATTN